MGRRRVEPRPLGSSKNTLLRQANRLIHADDGHIMVKSDDVYNTDPIGLRRRIGYIPEQPAYSIVADQDCPSTAPSPRNEFSY